MGYLDKDGLSRAFTKLKTLIDKKQDKMKQTILPSSTTTDKNKWLKFATIDLSSSKAWHCCSGTLSFTQGENRNVLGTLKFFCRNGGTAGVIASSSLTWVSLSDNSYAGSVAYVKAAAGKYDMYYKPLRDYETPWVTLVDCTDYNLFTFSYNSYVASITASGTSSVASHASSASSVPWSGVSGKPSTFTPSSHTHDDRYYTETEVDSKLSGKANSSHTHTKSQITDFPSSMKNPNSLTISLNGTSQGAYDGSAAKSINVTPSSIGAAASSHTHTKNQVGLGNVDNTADSAKSVKYAASAGSANALKVTELTTQNLNDIKTVGLYSAGGSNSVKNKPANVDAFGLEVKKTARGYLAQVLTEGNVHTMKTWIRQFNSSAWSAWEYYFDSRHTPTWSQVSGKPSFATVATSGSYNDLSNKPTIPTIPSSLKNPNSLTISLNGTSQGAYDGSSAKSINVTPYNIGAAPSSHTHNYAGSSSAGGNAMWANGATWSQYTYSQSGCVTTGSGSAYTTNVIGFSLTLGKSIVMVPHVTSTTTTPTLNVNSTGAKNIRMRLSSSTSSTIPLIRADFLTQYKPVKLTYDGTYWLIDDFIQPDANNLYGTLISRGSSAPSSGTAGFIYIQTT